MLGDRNRPWSSILDVVYSELVQSARDHNSNYSHALHLPAELLRAVLHFLPAGEQRPVAGVCQDWMHIAYSFPVVVCLPGSPEGLASLTERLRYLTPAPLHVRQIITGLDGRQADIVLLDFYAITCGTSGTWICALDRDVHSRMSRPSTRFAPHSAPVHRNCVVLQLPALPLDC